MFHKIATNQEIVNDILGLIGRAEKQIDIISPYIKLWHHLEVELETAARKEIIINVIFRADKKKEYEKLAKWLHDLGAHIFVVDNLHAKIYCSEKLCVITSMNLYDYSAANSEEFGFVSPDEELISSVRKYVEELRSRAVPLHTEKVGKVFKQSSSSKTKPTAKAPRKAIATTDDHSVSGFCIRCRCDLPLNPDKPLCPKCYKEWNKYKNPTYVEKNCHKCGAIIKTSLSKPVCLKCFKAAKA